MAESIAKNKPPGLEIWNNRNTNLLEKATKATANGSNQQSATDQKHTFQQIFHRYVLIIEKSKDP